MQAMNWIAVRSQYLPMTTDHRWLRTCTAIPPSPPEPSADDLDLESKTYVEFLEDTRTR
jgi:hypothetical protein